MLSCVCARLYNNTPHGLFFSSPSAAIHFFFFFLFFSLLLVIYKTELLHWWPCPESLVYFLVPFRLAFYLFFLLRHFYFIFLGSFHQSLVHLVQLLFFDGLPSLWLVEKKKEENEKKKERKNQIKNRGEEEEEEESECIDAGDEHFLLDGLSPVGRNQRFHLLALSCRQRKVYGVVSEKRPRDLAVDSLRPIRDWNGRGLSLHGRDDGPRPPGRSIWPFFRLGPKQVKETRERERERQRQKVESCRGKSPV